MGQTNVEDHDLIKMQDLSKKIISGEAPYNRNRESYLESVVEQQIESAYAIKDILEDIGL